VQNFKHHITLTPIAIIKPELNPVEIRNTPQKIPKCKRFMRETLHPSKSNYGYNRNQNPLSLPKEKSSKNRKNKEEGKGIFLRVHYQSQKIVSQDC